MSALSVLLLMRPLSHAMSTFSPSSSGASLPKLFWRSRLLWKRCASQKSSCLCVYPALIGYPLQQRFRSGHLARALG
jgi:hypothetical protein